MENNRFEAYRRSRTGFVALADVLSPGMPLAVAGALGIRIAGGESHLERITRFLEESDGDGGGVGGSLLILDNAEHLLVPQACREEFTLAVRSLLERASRLPLGMRGEREIAVAPLPVPPPEVSGETQSKARGKIEAGNESNPPGLESASESVRLYVNRARAARHDFNLTPANADAVRAICGALELAASWMRVLPPVKLWERLQSNLGEGLGLLKARYGDLPERHRSLEDVLDGSYRRLTPAEQRFFRELSVFSGGWTLEAAEAVCACTEVLDLPARMEEALLTRPQELAAPGTDSETGSGLVTTDRDSDIGQST